ncbi:hypothetical protein GCM10025868_20800 [Angustibacter aerolatus]|uniref:EAL domain-containing protein n=1 Tax=Angustibacter aerolatus TaxID=1162965 RepID=A0ABQ6JJ27_9ACTN|nr:hypothetical protein GCM10025868_20800 [Angustibacter aerolatus]
MAEQGRHTAGDIALVGVPDDPHDPLPPGMLQRVERRLRVALASGRLRLHFQPVVFLPSGRTAGYEALCRWHDDEARRRAARACSCGSPRRPG